MLFSSERSLKTLKQEHGSDLKEMLIGAEGCIRRRHQKDAWVLNLPNEEQEHQKDLSEVDGGGKSSDIADLGV